MSIHAVCFDLFHTLVDVARVPEEVGAYTADLLGVSREEWNRQCFSPAHEIRKRTEHVDVIRALAHAIDPTIAEHHIQQAVAHRQRRFEYALRNIEAPVLEAVEALYAMGIPLALVSNASTSEVEAWPQSPLAKYFSVALFSCQCGYAKPDAEIYQLALRSLDVAAEHCLFVGDGGSEEHRGAAEQGLIPVLLTHFLPGKSAEHLRERRRWVRHEFDRLDDVVRLVAERDEPAHAEPGPGGHKKSR